MSITKYTFMYAYYRFTHSEIPGMSWISCPRRLGRFNGRLVGRSHDATDESCGATASPHWDEESRLTIGTLPRCNRSLPEERSALFAEGTVCPPSVREESHDDVSRVVFREIFRSEKGLQAEAVEHANEDSVHFLGSHL